MNLLVAAQTRLHRWRLLLIPKRRRIRHRGDTRRRTKARLGKAKGAKERRRLAGHAEEGIVLVRGEGEGAGHHQVGSVPHRLWPWVGEGFVLVEDAGGLEPVLLVLRDIRQLLQVQQVRPHTVHVLGQRHVVGQ